MDRLSKLPLFGDPGEAISYGFQMDILGGIIDMASGVSLDQYYYENIFKPLDMTETYFQIPENLHPYKAYPIFDDARKVVYEAYNDAKCENELKML